jgi:hypothetical protein
MVLSHETYADVADVYPGLPSRTYELRGKGEQVSVRVWSSGPGADTAGIEG